MFLTIIENRRGVAKGRVYGVGGTANMVAGYFKTEGCG